MLHGGFSAPEQRDIARWRHRAPPGGTRLALSISMAPTNTEHLPRIALLESRMSRELSRLVEKHGGDPLCVPALREVPTTSEQGSAGAFRLNMRG